MAAIGDAPVTRARGTEYSRPPTLINSAIERRIEIDYFIQAWTGSKGPRIQENSNLLGLDGGLRR